MEWYTKFSKKKKGKKSRQIEMHHRLIEDYMSKKDNKVNLSELNKVFDIMPHGKIFVK